MKILFLHGFFATGSCIPARALKEALEPENVVLTPDLPMGPDKALPFIEDLCLREKVDFIIGNSCGSFYGQIIACKLGIPALLGNPYFIMTEFLRPRIGVHQYKAPRQDGNQDFIIDQALIDEFAKYEEHQFDGVTDWAKENIHGLFGEKDTLAHFEPMFREHFVHVSHFPGGHTPTVEETKEYYATLLLANTHRT